MGNPFSNISLGQENNVNPTDSMQGFLQNFGAVTNPGMFKPPSQNGLDTGQPTGLMGLFQRFSNPSSKVNADYGTEGSGGLLDFYNQGGPAPPPTVNSLTNPTSNRPMQLDLASDDGMFSGIG